MATISTNPGTMTSRERVDAALAHAEPDRVPLDLGAAPTTGMHVDSVYLLRQALGLDPPGTPVKVAEPFQMLGEIAPDLREALGVDVVGVGPPGNFFGFAQDDWKPWTTFGGTPVLVPGLFNTEPDEKGDILMYPEGDTSVPPCARMPEGGFYFDAIIRQEPFDEDDLDPADNAEEFTLLTADDVAHVKRSAEEAAEAGLAVMFVVGDTGIGDIAFVPGLKLKHPRGIRDIEQWYMSLSLRPEHVREIFERQTRGRPREPEGGPRGLRRRDHGRLRDRHRLRRAGPAVHLAEALPRPVQAVPHARKRLDPRQHRAGRASCTRTARCGSCSPTSSRPGSTSSTRCRRRRRTWSPSG